MEVDQKALFHLLDLAILNSYFFSFMLWEQNLTWRFLTHPYQRDAGTGWT
jgi:hypothetical protein